jgi:hypothetical protein
MHAVLPVVFVSVILGGLRAQETGPPLCRSARSGRWSDAATWQERKVPGGGARVQIASGHVVTFDVKTDAVIRSIHVAGTLRFDPRCDTRLDVGLIKIQAGDDASESGFDCENHVMAPDPADARPALEVGTPDEPIGAEHTAVIRLTAVPGLDAEECPAIVCCGGRWDLHGRPLGRTWVKLGAPAPQGSTTLTLDEPVKDWRVGDRLIVTATSRQVVRLESELKSVRELPQTEERVIAAVRKDGREIVLNSALAHEHMWRGNRRAEVANLSRNVIIESAAPDGVRGHTMYHRHSAGSISYAEFRHLGKEGKLGKYSVHFHRVSDTMRGSSVIGASIWDSANRFITIHGTNTLVVRDCVGYRSTGHGFFLEDGTEVENILDRNLAVQVFEGKPLPGQVFPQDGNQGAGFWWANSRNAFTRNVAVECDGYGYRFDAPGEAGAGLSLAVKDAHGQASKVDIRTLPFIRFESNEAHDNSRYALNLGGGSGSGVKGGVGQVGPDSRHPFVIRNFNAWDALWGVTLSSPSVLIDGLDLTECTYGFWRPRYERHAYRGVVFYRVKYPEAYAAGKRPEESAYPAPLERLDDQPPVTVMTRIKSIGRGRVVVQGVTVDDGTVRSVVVNGHAAEPLSPNFLDWQVELDTGPSAGSLNLSAQAEDICGNTEPVPHRAAVVLP